MQCFSQLAESMRPLTAQCLDHGSPCGSPPASTVEHVQVTHQQARRRSGDGQPLQLPQLAEVVTLLVDRWVPATVSERDPTWLVASRRAPARFHVATPRPGMAAASQSACGPCQLRSSWRWWRERWPTTSSPGADVPVPRQTRRSAGRPPMARTGSPPTPGSRHRGSVGGHPRSGDRAACPPAPSDSPSLETQEAARRPGLSVGTWARSAVAPCAPFLVSVPHVGGNPTPIGGGRHPAFYTKRAKPRSDRLPGPAGNDHS